MVDPPEISSKDPFPEYGEEIDDDEFEGQGTAIDPPETGGFCHWSFLPAVCLVIAAAAYYVNADVFPSNFGGDNKKYFTGEDCNGFANKGEPVTPEEALRCLSPRTFSKFDGSIIDLPCFPPKNNWKSDHTPSNVGFLLSKPVKVGGSTAAGVHARIARNVADRQGQDFPLCDLRWDHNSGMNRKDYPHRHKSKSLLWTVLRNPTQRLVSQFYHFYVSRGKANATAVSFMDMLHKDGRVKDYYFRRESFLDTPDPILNVENIFDELDFIAITERMDESFVALAMLWGLPLADVLFMSAKTAGGYDGGGGGCHLIPKKKPVPGLQKILDSEYFQKLVQWDNVVYELANSSLDKTIDEVIGRDKFNKALKTFRNALKVVDDKCSSEVKFPCTEGGIDQEDSIYGKPWGYKQTDCLVRDSGCGYMCLDDVATELDLWEPAGELSYKYPAAFGMGLSTRERLKARIKVPQSEWKTGWEPKTVTDTPSGSNKPVTPPDNGGNKGNSVSPGPLPDDPSIVLERFPIRTFKPFEGDYLPCFTPDPRWMQSHYTMTKGLVFSKPTKVGGSTAAGVLLRIARNVADRIGQKFPKRDFPICALRWEHGAQRKIFRNRDYENSLVWTVFRDPTTRMVSQFYHFQVSRGLMNATAANFEKFVRETKMLQNYYFGQASIAPYERTKSPQKHLESIFSEFDFIGLTERMDESFVALSLLWNLPLADVLYLSAKTHGGYDGGGGGCHLIPKGVRVPGMQEFLDSDYVQDLIKWDHVVHQIANKTLDATIDNVIGRKRFETAFAKYEHAMQVAAEKCSPEIIMPCSNGGIPTEGKKYGKPYAYKQTDCIVRDSGCGYMCLDDVASELGLWGDKGELSYRYPDYFGMGNSSRTRLDARLHSGNNRWLQSGNFGW